MSEANELKELKEPNEPGASSDLLMPTLGLLGVITTTSDPTTTNNKTAELRDRYAALLSRALTTEAQTLVRSVFGSFAYWQRHTGKRVRKYGEKTGKTYHDAIERFIGDLLRAKGDNRSSGRIFHATGATTFHDVPVGYVFKGMLAGLEAVGLVGFNKGRMSDRRATTFRATEKLLDLATHYGVRLQNIRTDSRAADMYWHHAPEQPTEGGLFWSRHYTGFDEPTDDERTATDAD
jgi:hypothetical protein